MDVNQLYDEWKVGRTEQQKKAFKELLDKNNIEFNRYKQDCRKRSMDLAHTEYQDWYRESNSKSSNPGTLGEKPNIIELADKYYNWLISIPQ